MNKYENINELIVRLIIKRNQKVLLCLNKKTGSYFLPGGHVEFGDTLEKTIYKETAEELGWKESDITSFKFKDYLEHSYVSDGIVHAELNMIFDVEISDTVPTESKENHIGFDWIDIETIPSTNLLPETIGIFIS